MDVSSYLLKPVQRISKYSLLLQDLVRECGLQRAREMPEVQAALEVIQFQLRHGNNLLAMDDIQDCDVSEGLNRETLFLRTCSCFGRTRFSRSLSRVNLIILSIG